MCAGVQPCGSPTQQFNIEVSVFKINPVKICNLELAPIRGRQ